MRERPRAVGRGTAARLLDNPPGGLVPGPSILPDAGVTLTARGEQGSTFLSVSFSTPGLHVTQVPARRVELLASNERTGGLWNSLRKRL